MDLGHWIGRWNDEGFQRDLTTLKAHGVDSPELGWFLLPLLEDLNSAYMRTYRNRRICLFAPDPEDLDADDICHHLALENRFNGSTIAPYSVAQHLVWCREVLVELCQDPRIQAEHQITAAPPMMDQFTMLFHDAPEAYLKDFPRALKNIFKPFYDLLDARMWCAMVKRWPALRPEGKTALMEVVDNMSAATEMRDLFIKPRLRTKSGAPHPKKIVPWDWKMAEQMMQDAAYSLLGSDI